jgi:hypothetical protein
VFNTVPTGGFYLRVNDDTVDANMLTITLVGVIPSTPGGFIQTAGGAIINWP